MKADVIIARKSSRSENIVFIGFESDDLGFLTQVVDWKQHPAGVEAGLKILKDKKAKGLFVDGQFRFDPNGLEIEVQ